jgi:FAD/FMN-containing dehydrogenase
VAAYEAAVAAAPAGYMPPPVTSVSVDVTVGGTV